MTHDILGKVERSDGEPFDAVATIRYGSRDVEIGICCEGFPIATAVTFAAEVVQNLADLDRQARRVATADLRTTYNSGWNEYDIAHEDGTFETVSNPQLSEADFQARLSLTAINLSGEATIEFFYDDDQMFWGHSVVVISSNGLDFSDAYAQLFG